MRPSGLNVAAEAFASARHRVRLVVVDDRRLSSVPPSSATLVALYSYR